VGDGVVDRGEGEEEGVGLAKEEEGEERDGSDTGKEGANCGGFPAGAETGEVVDGAGDEEGGGIEDGEGVGDGVGLTGRDKEGGLTAVGAGGDAEGAGVGGGGGGAGAKTLGAGVGERNEGGGEDS